MSNNYNGIFADIGSTQVTRQGVYLGAGNHILQCVRCKLQQSQKDHNKLWFIAEFKVIESDNPKHKPGHEVTWLQDMDKPTRQGAVGNVKGFALGFDPDSGANVGEDEMLAIIGENSPVKGLAIRAQGIELTTKANRLFTKFNWHYVEQGKTLADCGFATQNAPVSLEQPQNGVAPPNF